MCNRYPSWYSDFFTWIRRKWYSISDWWRGSEVNRNSNEIRQLESDADAGLDDLRCLLRSEFSMYFDERPTQFRWKLLIKKDPSNINTSTTIFPVTTPTINYYGNKDPTWCTSIVKVNCDDYWMVQPHTIRFYQSPMACPTAPVYRLTMLVPERAYAYYHQLHPRKTLIAVLYSILEMWFEPGDKIDTFTIFDLDQQKDSSELRRQIRVPKMHKFVACFFEESVRQDSRVKFIFYENHLDFITDDRGILRPFCDHLLVNVYVGDLSTSASDGDMPLQLVDSMMWTAGELRYERVYIKCVKYLDNDYFVWVLELANRAGRGSWNTKMVCVTYERGDDGIWMWSNEAMPLMEWATTTEKGRRFWAGVEFLKEIWDNVKGDSTHEDSDDIRRLGMIEIKYNEGLIFASTDRGYFCRYAFRPPTLQSMTVDLVREMVEKETEETKSLAKWNWWRTLIGAGGLFEPCPSDYGENELNAEDFL